MVVPQRSNFPVDPKVSFGAGDDERTTGGCEHDGREGVNPGAPFQPDSLALAVEQFGTRLLASRFTQDAFDRASSDLAQMLGVERLWIEHPSEPSLRISGERFRVEIALEGSYWGDLCATRPQGAEEFDAAAKSALCRAATHVSTALTRDLIEGRAQEQAAQGRVATASAEIAREFRSLLWPLQLNGEMLERSTQLQSRERQMVADIMHVAASASAIVSRLLASAPPSLSDCAQPIAQGSTEALPLARKGERVLFVDDEQVVREVASELLRELGYEVRTVDSAEAGLRLLETDSAFSLVVTDLLMYEMDGISFAAEVHRRWPTLGVVCCTGYGDASDQSRAEAAGIRRLVRKPVPMESFAQIIRAAIDCA